MRNGANRAPRTSVRWRNGREEAARSRATARAADPKLKSFQGVRGGERKQ